MAELSPTQSSVTTAYVTNTAQPPSPTPSIVDDWLIPAVCILGYAGNALVVMVMLRRTFRRTAMGVYLGALALTDSACLVNAFPLFWLHVRRHANVFGYAPAACTAFEYYTYTSNTASSWLLVGVTLERCACVVRPLLAARVFSRKRALLGLGLTFAGVFVLYLPLLWVYDLVPSPDGGDTCDKTPGFLHSPYYLVMVWTDMAAGSLLPFAVILTLNAVIIWKLRESHRMRACAVSQRSQSSQRSQRSLVFMLVVTSIAFVVLTMPLMVEQVMSQTAGPPSGMFFEVSLLCLKMNNAANFYLYCVSGRKFRRELRAMMCGGRAGGETTGSVSVSAGGRRAAASIPGQGREKAEAAPGGVMEGKSPSTQDGMEADIVLTKV